MPGNPLSIMESPPSPALSDSSEVDNVSAASAIGPSVSRRNSPSAPPPAEPSNGGTVGEDSVTCLWDNCGMVYTHLPTLIEHIHKDHIGVHKSNYTCEWATCPRRGLAQTSRFALISHIRSHTGEKPFTCTLPECDKSFTRSDALAKHMRLQHNISPPAPGRGGSKKRKRPVDDQPVAVHPTSRVLSPPPVPTAGGGAFSTFKLEQNPYPDLSNSFTHKPTYLEDDSSHKIATNGYRSVSPLSPPYPPRLSPPDPNRHDEDEGYTSSTSDTLPAHLLPHYVPATNLVLGRTPSMVMYLLMKAKHRYALEQHESLLEELRVARAEMKKEKEEKESTLDEFLRGMFGAQGEMLIEPIPPPPSMNPALPPALGADSAPVPMSNGNLR